MLEEMVKLTVRDGPELDLRDVKLEGGANHHSPEMELIMVNLMEQVHVIWFYCLLDF